MEESTHRLLQIPTGLSGEGAQIGEIAESMVSTWHDIDAALGSIIGKGGVVALYKSSVHVTSAAHPWLADLAGGIPATADLGALKAALTKPGATRASAGADALLLKFRELPPPPLGPGINRAPFGPIWATILSGAPERDTDHEHESKD